jgi:hypothetical protein
MEERRATMSGDTCSNQLSYFFYFRFFRYFKNEIDRIPGFCKKYEFFFTFFKQNPNYFLSQGLRKKTCSDIQYLPEVWKRGEKRK